MSISANGCGNVETVDSSAIQGLTTHKPSRNTQNGPMISRSIGLDTDSGPITKLSQVFAESDAFQTAKTDAKDNQNGLDDVLSEYNRNFEKQGVEKQGDSRRLLAFRHCPQCFATTAYSAFRSATTKRRGHSPDEQQPSCQSIAFRLSACCAQSTKHSRTCSLCSLNAHLPVAPHQSALCKHSPPESPSSKTLRHGML